MSFIKLLLRLSCFCFIPPLLAQTEPLTILLDWYPNPDQGPLYVAQAEGYFKDKGLNIKLISPTDPGDALKLVAAGKADLAISYQPTLVLALAEGLPLVRTATLVDQPLNVIAVRADSPIFQVKDLKGKTIGYSVDGTDHVMLDTALEKAGLGLNQVHLINVHYDLSQALMTQHVDAVTGIMRNVEPIEMANQGVKVRLFPYEENGVPSYDELIMVTNQHHRNDPRLRAFNLALDQAATLIKHDPDRAWGDFIHENPSLNNALNKTIWTATLPFFANQPTTFNPNRYQTFATYLQKEGVIKILPPVSDYTLENTPD